MAETLTPQDVIKQLSIGMGYDELLSDIIKYHDDVYAGFISPSHAFYLVRYIRDLKPFDSNTKKSFREFMHKIKQAKYERSGICHKIESF